MVVRNISSREDLFHSVVSQASKISKNFFIVDHWSDDNTKNILWELQNEFSLDLELVHEDFLWTMDDMKGKYYKVLKGRYWEERNFIFILDWDEVLDDKLVDEIQLLDFKKDVYFINRHTYLIKEAIDRNSYLPLLFEANSVEVAPFETFHKLYNVKSKNTIKLKWVLHHYSYRSIQDLFQKNIFYAKNEAIALFQTNHNINNFSIFCKFLFEWMKFSIYSLIYHFNFLTLEWWMYSWNWMIYKFYKYLFYLELKNGSKNKYSGNM